MDDTTAAQISAALENWVHVRAQQAARSQAAGKAQQGRRSAVTGGLHLAAINQLVVAEISRTGAKDLDVRVDRRATLAGYYRATKSWDLVVARGHDPVLAVEYKSMSGSEGNNLNNRADEIFGMAEDARQAELKSILPPRMRRAYVFIMGDNPDSTRPVGVNPSLGNVDPAFRGASYVQRMAIMCKRMRETGLFHMTWAVAVKEKPFSWYEPDLCVGWDRFAADIHTAFPHGDPSPNPDMF